MRTKSRAPISDSAKGPTSHNLALVMPLIYIVELTGVRKIQKSKLRWAWFPTTSPPKFIQNSQLLAKNCQRKKKQRHAIVYQKKINTI